MGLRWYVLRTEPRAEYLAADELTKDEFEVFFPLVNSQQHRLGHADEPLFPGYLFIRFDDDADEWPFFRAVHRIAGWVNFKGIIPSVPDEVISELAARVDSINAGQGLWRRFKPGELVRVVSGEKDDFAEVLEEAKSPQGRARVLMEFMGRQIQAQVPWQNLRPVDETQVESRQAPRRTRGRGRWIRGHGPAGVTAA